jgi:hypothetical protein
MRRLPPTVAAFAVLNVVWIVFVLAISTSVWQYHASRGAVSAVLIFLWIAAIVVWRQRWAWALMLLFQVAVLLSPAWKDWSGPVPYAVNVVTVALLVSPGMLRWVRVTRRAQPRPST